MRNTTHSHWTWSTSQATKAFVKINALQAPATVSVEGSDTVGTVLASILRNENIEKQPAGMQRLMLGDAILNNGSTLSEASVEHEATIMLVDESVQQGLGPPQASRGEGSRHAEAASDVSPIFLAPPAIVSALADPRVTPVLLEGVLEAKRQTLSFMWNKRKFAIYTNNTFRRYDGDELRQISAITPSTVVTKVGSLEFTVSFIQRQSGEVNLHYHLRATSSHARDQWVHMLLSRINFSAVSAQSALSNTPSSHAKSSPPAHARVLFEYTASDAEELALTAGHLIEVIYIAMHLSTLNHASTSPCCRSRTSMTVAGGLVAPTAKKCVQCGLPLLE